MLVLCATAFAADLAATAPADLADWIADDHAGPSQRGATLPVEVAELSLGGKAYVIRCMRGGACGLHEPGRADALGAVVFDKVGSSTGKIPLKLLSVDQGPAALGLATGDTLWLDSPRVDGADLGQFLRAP